MNRLAFPPRHAKPWRYKHTLPKKRLLFLAATLEVGHGVAVVMQQHAEYFSRAGYQVYVGGPDGKAELGFVGCKRIILNDAKAAACFAVEEGIHCVIAETPPFFSVTRYFDKWPRTILIDHGEPPPSYLAMLMRVAPLMLRRNSVSRWQIKSSGYPVQFATNPPSEIRSSYETVIPIL